jgi:hypothetical protein
MVATKGVLRVGCVVPSTLGNVRSRPIVNSVLVTWMSVVSRVAIVESSSATMRSLPPRPCHTA